MRKWVAVGVVLVVLVALGAALVLVLREKKDVSVEDRISIVNNDPNFDLQYYTQDPLWQKYVEDLGIFEENGIKVIDDENRKVSYTTIKKIQVYIEPEVQDVVMVRDKNRNPLFSWSYKLNGNAAVFKMNINSLAFPEDSRWEKVGSSLQGMIAYRLANISTKYHRTVTSGEDKQMLEVRRLINLTKTHYLLVRGK